MFWAAALCSPPQRFLKDLVRRSVQLRGPNLMASDQTAINSLPQRLADEVPLDRAGLDQVKDRSAEGE